MLISSSVSLENMFFFIVFLVCDQGDCLSISASSLAAMAMCVLMLNELQGVGGDWIEQGEMCRREGRWWHRDAVPWRTVCCRELKADLGRWYWPDVGKLIPDSPLSFRNVCFWYHFCSFEELFKHYHCFQTKCCRYHLPEFTETFWGACLCWKLVDMWLVAGWCPCLADRVGLCTEWHTSVESLKMPIDKSTLFSLKVLIQKKNERTNTDWKKCHRF